MFMQNRACRKFMATVGVSILPCFATLGLQSVAHANLRFTLQPDDNNNLVISITEFGASPTTGSDGSITTLDDDGVPAAGASNLAFVGGLSGDAFGAAFAGVPASANFDPVFDLSTPLTVNFNGNNLDLIAIAIDDDAPPFGDDDFVFQFSGPVPTNAPFNVVDTGFSTLVDTDGEIGTAGALVPFTDLNDGTFNALGNGNSMFLAGGVVPTADNPGIEIVVSSTVVPEPSTVWGSLLSVMGGIALYMKSKRLARKAQKS